MEPTAIDILKNELKCSLTELETLLNSDVIVYYGAISEGIENEFRSIIEEISSERKHDTLSIILTTPGGSATVVERYVNVIRYNYSKIRFVIPDFAYSAGTIFCMSGDEIWMDYFSVLGPIDPQVPNKEGKYVPAMGYLDKISELIEKAQKNTLTQAEFLILKDFDLAELKGYEQAKELTITLLRSWLVQYKFKNWNEHANGTPVTHEEKESRAEQIASALGDYTRWKTHGRPINIKTLETLKLRVNDYSSMENERECIRKYYKLMREFIKLNNLPIFVQTRLFL